MRVRWMLDARENEIKQLRAYVARLEKSVKDYCVELNRALAANVPLRDAMICACGDTLTDFVCSTCRTTERSEARAEGRDELMEWRVRAEAAERALVGAQRFREQDADIYEAAAAEALAKLTLLHAENERLRVAEQRVTELESAVMLAVTQLSGSPNTQAFLRATLEAREGKP